MKRVLVVLALTAALAALFAFGLQPRDPRDLDSPFIDKTLDDFEAPVIERYRAQYGETLRYSDLAGNGTPLVVNFWASWCPACRTEAPLWKAAWEEYSNRVTFLGINFQDEAENANAFLDEFNKPFPSVRDPKGNIGIAWGVFGMPESYFIRGDGTLAYKQTGAVNAEIINTQIQALLE